MRDARRRCVVALLAVAGLLGPAHAATDTGWDALRSPAVVLFRHAQAPGIGDPPQFRLGDCATQRNLDATGRLQARRIGEAFRQRRIEIGAVLASQWCRTHETAELAFPGRVRDDADFNSFYSETDPDRAQTARAAATLARWRGPGVLVVVTHQVNITALTGYVPESGEGVVVRPGAGDGKRLDVVATVQP